EQIVLAALVGTVIPYAINVVSRVGLRRYRSDVTPTFEAPGGVVLPAVAFVFLGSMVVGLGVDQPLTSVLALCGVGLTVVLWESVTDAAPSGTVVESDD